MVSVGGCRWSASPYGSTRVHACPTFHDERWVRFVEAWHSFHWADVIGIGLRGVQRYWPHALPCCWGMCSFFLHFLSFILALFDIQIKLLCQASPAAGVPHDLPRLPWSDNAAMTSPDSFRITATIPDWSESTNIAPSKLVFNIAAAGGFHFILLCFVPRALDLLCFWNSLRSEPVDSRIFPSGKLGLLHLSLFLRHQIDHATVAKRSSCLTWSPTNETKSAKEVIAEKSFLIHPKISECRVFSGPVQHCEQVESSKIFLGSRLDFLGSASEHAPKEDFYLVHVEDGMVLKDDVEFIELLK